MDISYNFSVVYCCDLRCSKGCQREKMEISCVSVGWIYYCSITDLVVFNKLNYMYVEIF